MSQFPTPPTAPSLADPANFDTRTDAFLAWMTSIATQWNTTEPYIEGDAAILASVTTTGAITSAGGFVCSGLAAHTRSGGVVMTLDRTGTDGTILGFQKSGATKIEIGNLASAGNGYIGNGATGLAFSGSSNTVYPISTTTGATRDNAIDLGLASGRFDDIYASNGTINTSDKNEKQEIAKLSPELMKVAARVSKEFVSFKWNSAVEGKGKQARSHFGAIAQRVEEAFYAEGLNPWDYGVLTMGSWMESTGLDGVVTRHDIEGEDEVVPDDAELRVLLGVRYNELQSFIAAYNEQRFTAMEQRLAVIEAK